LAALGLGLMVIANLPVAAAAETPPRRMFVYGDSLAADTEPFLPRALPRWQLEQDAASGRTAAEAAAALRARGDSLSPIVHLSLGTLDDPARPRRYRRAIDRTMGVVGPTRCVVWANVSRPAVDDERRWERLNEVLDEEAAHRDNLIVVDWYSIVTAHSNWPRDPERVEVNERGNRARSRAVAAAARRCRERLAYATSPTRTSVAVPRRLFVYGDSMARGSAPFVPSALPNWRVKQDVEADRHAPTAPGGLSRRGERLSPIIHLSLGTVDDPTRLPQFRRSIRRSMRVAGPRRCVVWLNIYRPSKLGEPGWTRLNGVLAEEELRRDNLVVMDWFSIVVQHPEWLSKVDATHVDERGYRRRAEAVADGARECRRRLELGRPLTAG
jgi:hypothetical protein